VTVVFVGEAAASTIRHTPRRYPRPGIAGRAVLGTKTALGGSTGIVPHNFGTRLRRPPAVTSRAEPTSIP
jgi:hypothetical protein